MGLIIDTGVFVFIERRRSAIDLSQTFGSELLGISTITVSELLVGVLRADSQARRDFRQSILDTILAGTTAYPFSVDTARIHARLNADLQTRGQIIGAHDLIIAATALEHGHAVLPTNRR